MNILNKLTKNYLKLNKKRTIVTIIGIVLAGAMISAVATLAVSFQAFLINAEEQDSGKWQAYFYDVEYKDSKYITNNSRFENCGIMADYVMADNIYSDETVLEVKAFDKIALENMGVKLISGRLPENSDEVVLSKSFFDGKDNEPKIGDKVTFDIGTININEETNEDEINKTGTKTFTICGIINKPRFESSAYTSGITLLDNSIELNEDSLVDIGIRQENPKNIYTDAEKVAEDLNLYTNQEETQQKKSYNIKYNNNVLAYYGVNKDGGFTEMLYGVCGILILVIGIGSILVIYNSFAISVSERKKQFGMLSSVGATKKQIRYSVLYEGALLGIIGIPLGVLSGIAGIGITLKIVDNLLKSIIDQSTGNFNLELVISWPAIIIAVILIIITILLSVILPARRASKISPIDAIRQSDDIKIKAKKLRTPKFIRKIFKIEGDIALKNLKRSRKRYRTTVVSLIISIVLFVSITGFVDYMFKGFDALYKTPNYDFYINITDAKNKAEESKDNALEYIQKIKNTKKIITMKTFSAMIEIPEEKMSSNFKKIINENKEMGRYYFTIEDNRKGTAVSIITLDEENLKQYLKQQEIQKLNDNQIILVNNIDALSSLQLEFNPTEYKQGDKISIREYAYGEIDVNEKEVEIAKVTEEVPEILEGQEHGIIIITTEEGLQNISTIEKDAYIQCSAYINAEKENLDEIRAELKELQNKYTDIQFYIGDIQEMLEQNRSLKLIIQIFLYGFIALISLIGISNVFNTISTNINLRRREFANLKSIGMTDKQFKRMLNLECIFYGTKALLYGIPISILICYLLNLAFSSGIVFIFSIPWMSILISILAVYIVVFITMIYSSKKVKKENIIDVLRNDNI